MCSIMASYKLETIKKLVKINEHRGNFSWSITQNLKTNKDFGVKRQRQHTQPLTIDKDVKA